MIGEAKHVKQLRQKAGETIGHDSENDVEEQPDEKCSEKRYDLIVGDAAGVHADADIGSAYQH